VLRRRDNFSERVHSILQRHDANHVAKDMKRKY
jgi:hypothetical protein